jgi:hypothetical protein
MRDLGQIVADNGNDNTPALDTHNLTGRAVVDYAPLADLDGLGDVFDQDYPGETMDWAREFDAYPGWLGIIGDECG